MRNGIKFTLIVNLSRGITPNGTRRSRADETEGCHERVVSPDSITCLPGVFHGPSLTDYDDFDLAGIR